MPTISENITSADSEKMEDDKVEATSSSDMSGEIPDTSDMERDDAEEVASDGKAMKVDKETLREVMQEIKSEEQFSYMFENRTEKELEMMEKLIAKRRAELKKSGGKSKSSGELPTSKY